MRSTSALANEIDNLKQKLSTKEDEQIETLLKLDDAKETLDIAKSKISEKVNLLIKDRDLFEKIH